MDSNFIPLSVYNRLPAILSDVCKLYEDRSRDVVLLSSITALSACFPNVTAYYDSDIIYPNLYLMIVAPAASGKSVMMKSRKLIEPIHKYVKDKQDAPNWSMDEIDFCQDEVAQFQNDVKEEKKKKKDYVQPIKTIVAADSSNAELVMSMRANPNGIIMIESEMDTMGNVLKKEWGNYSDLMRKAFHHEPISVSRKMEKIDIEIGEPKMSLLLSGTPEQVKGITQSKENGLLSRFLIYSYYEVTEFKNVFPKNPTSINKLFENQGQEVLKMYKVLEELSNPVIFTLTETQQKKFLDFFRKWQEIIVNDEPLPFISNLRRLALIHFRICMILTICRNKDTLQSTEQLYCTNIDFMISINIITVLIDHSLISFKSYDKINVSLLETKLLDVFKSREQFTRAEFIVEGGKLKMRERTLGNRLKSWEDKGILIKISGGIYKVNSEKVE